MNPEDNPQVEGAGLCGICRFRRVIQSGKGSVFLMCLRAKEDPSYRKYPVLPKFNCPGFSENSSGDGGS